MDNFGHTVKQTLQQAQSKSIECHIYFGINNIPQIKENDNVAQTILDVIDTITTIQDKDILIIASKIVSKAEGNIINLSNIKQTDDAIELSKISGKSPMICQVILNESASHFVENGTIIALHKNGFRLTSAGVDKINNNFVATIPCNPDKSARQIMEYIKEQTGKDVAVIIYRQRRKS